MAEKNIKFNRLTIALSVLCIVFIMATAGIAMMSSSINTDLQNQYNNLQNDYSNLQVSNSAYVNTHSHTNDEFERIKITNQNLADSLQNQLDSVQSQLSDAYSMVQEKEKEIAAKDSQVANLYAAQLVKVNFQYADSHSGSSSAVTVNGTVFNSGSETAYNVVLTIQALGPSNNVLGSGTVSLGAISSSSYKNFQQSLSYEGTVAYSSITTTFSYT